METSLALHITLSSHWSKCVPKITTIRRGYLVFEPDSQLKFGIVINKRRIDN